MGDSDDSATLLFKVSAGGGQSWGGRVDGPLEDATYGTDLEITASGTLIIGGRQGLDSWFRFVSAENGANGAVVEVEHILLDLAVDADGAIVAVGEGELSSGWVRMWDPDGSVPWTRVFDEVPWRVAFDSNGDVAFTGLASGWAVWTGRLSR